MLKVLINGEEINVRSKSTLMELAKEHSYTYPALVAKYNNEVTDLSRKITADCSVEFLDITSKEGHRAYQNSMLFMLIYSAKEVYGKDTVVSIKHSIGKNYYCNIEKENLRINEREISILKEKMLELVNSKVVIEKELMPVTTAMKIAKENYMFDILEILKYRRGTNVHMYKLNDMYNFFCSSLVLECEKLNKFELNYYEDGLIIRFPDRNNPEEILNTVRAKKLIEVFEESDEWARILEINTVGNLNKRIIDNDFGNIIRISEALQEKKIAEIADNIYKQNKKIVLIAGPSSSGKTTFAHRVSVQLKVNKLRPHVISLDDYYLDRSEIPLDENGKQNFEVVESLDINMINDHLNRLLKGETVEIPSFNFSAGIKEFKGETLTLGANDVLIMEGIHGLNDIISSSVPKESKYKIFISALTQLTIDNHNRIATTDLRLMRRIVRDSKFRGFNPLKTMGMWAEVVQGEIENIFPYQDAADSVFNSALVYELSVLKTYIEPALFGVLPDSEQYGEARRLIKMLENFLVADDNDIPNNSLIREFIGGSVFRK
ncbi:MAG: nucleoside kinase [Lachnospirales bacterium]